MRRKILLVVLPVTIISVMFFFFIPANNSVKHTIILTENGFSPDKIKINNGDAIIFKTETGKPFWPASDLHPTHGIYPEFDPLEPVPSEKSYEFVFTKKGTWRFHDHLEPYFRGVIEVQ